MDVPQLFQLFDSLTTIGILGFFAWYSLNKESRREKRDVEQRAVLEARLEAMDKWQREVMIEAIFNNTAAYKSFNEHMAKFSGFVERGETCPLGMKNAH